MQTMQVYDQLQSKEAEAGRADSLFWSMVQPVDHSFPACSRSDRLCTPSSVSGPFANRVESALTRKAGSLDHLDVFQTRDNLIFDPVPGSARNRTI